MSTERQATVRTFDPVDRGGDLLADDGTVLPYRGSAVDVGVRLLRPGQRVRARVTDGVVEVLTLLTLPLPPPAGGGPPEGGSRMGA